MGRPIPSDDEKAILQLLAAAPTEGMRHAQLKAEFMSARGRSESTFNRALAGLKDDPRIIILNSGAYALKEMSGVKPVS